MFAPVVVTRAIEFGFEWLHTESGVVNAVGVCGHALVPVGEWPHN